MFWYDYSMYNFSSYHNKMINWMLGIGADVKDYLLWSIISEVQKAPVIKKPIPPVNQNKELWGKLRSACTVVNAFRAWCTVVGVTPDTAMRQDLRDYAKEIGGYREWVGNYSAHGVNIARKFIKDELHRDLLSFTTPIFTQDYNTAISRGYPIVVSYRGNELYNADYQKDNILDQDSFGELNYGHCTLQKFDKKLLIDDSFAGTTWNIYEITKMNNLLKNGIYYPNAYVFVADPNWNIKSEYEKYREEVEVARQWAIARWLTNGLDWDKPVLREQMWVTLYRNNK